MKSIPSNAAAWSAVSESYTIGIWCKLWPNYIPDSEDHGSAVASITRNAKEIRKEIGLGDVEGDDKIELLESHGEEFSVEM
jgi:hypothetical protein